MSPPRLPLEARFLFAAAREPEWDRDEVGRLAQGGPDWTQIRALATQERLVTVIWPRLVEAGIEVPAAHADAFRMQSSVSEFQLAFAESVLRQVVATARRLSVDLLLLKGAALALTVYPAFRDRPMGDLDVLARPDQARRLWEALRAEGWGLEFEGGETFYEDHQHLPPLVRGGGVGVVLEVHRSLHPPRGPFPEDDARAWADASLLELAEGPVRILSPERQLLHLAIHFGWSHALGRGLSRSVRDVSAVVGRTPPEWGRLVDAARGARAGTVAYWTLRLAASLGGARVPPDVLAALAPPRPAWVLDRLEGAYVEGGLFRSCPSARILQGMWTLGVAPRASGHGTARPWAGDELFREVVARDPASGAPPPLARLARVPAGLGYLARVARGTLGGLRVDREG